MIATNAAKLSCKPLIIFVGAPEEIRTPDPQIRSLVLCPDAPRASVCDFSLSSSALRSPSAIAARISLMPRPRRPATCGIVTRVLLLQTLKL
jgi:hypothetical protein